MKKRIGFSSGGGALASAASLCLHCYILMSSDTTAVQGLWTPLATKFNIYQDDKNEVSIETDFNLGYEAKYEGKPSDYHELRDGFLTSFNAKQWLKFNLNIFDFVIKSIIFEWTWFEFQPFKL